MPTPSELPAKCPGCNSKLHLSREPSRDSHFYASCGVRSCVCAPGWGRTQAQAIRDWYGKNGRLLPLDEVV